MNHQTPLPKTAAAASAPAPVAGLASFLGLPVGAASAWLAGIANHGVTAGANTTGVAIGVLAAAVIGLIAFLASRVRQERWPWLGVLGAALSASPLALFILGMMVMR